MCGIEKKSPRVTIGLPFMNNRDTLPLAIKSIYAQSFQDWELLLVDDGSTDGSIHIVQSIQDSRVNIFRDGKHKGLAVRLNEIAERASGNYLARMDADDLMHPERLARQVKFLDQHINIDLVCTGSYSIDCNYHVVGIRKLSMINKNPLSILKHNIFIHPTIMGRTDWFKRNRYDILYDRAEDYELWCRTFQNLRFAIINEPLYFYREIGAFNLRNYLKSCFADIRILKKYGPKYVGKFITNFLILRVYLKLLIYQTAYIIGLHDFLINRRSCKLNPCQIAEVDKIINMITKIEVPGLRNR
jgi:glycosyltransferase involved in cell wall biosynthesis